MAVDAFQRIRTHAEDLGDVLNGLADLDLRDEDGQSLLHEAVAYGNEFAVRQLLSRGAAVDARDRNGETPLHYAAARQNADTVRLLLQAGADPAAVDVHENSALWTAVFNARGNYETVRLLLDPGCRALAKTKNKHGRSPLDFAQQIGDAILVELLST